MCEFKNGEKIEISIEDLQNILDDFVDEIPPKYLHVLDFIELNIIDRAEVIASNE